MRKAWLRGSLFKGKLKSPHLIHTFILFFNIQIVSLRFIFQEQFFFSLHLYLLQNSLLNQVFELVYFIKYFSLSYIIICFDNHLL